MELIFFFFFSSRRRHTRLQGDWSSDVCSSDLGELNRLISEDGLRGMTSNPSIFEKAIGESALYDGALRDFQGQHDSDPLTIFEHLAVADIRQAADMLRPVHQATRGRDGYVSLEVSPYIALRTADTIADARRLWRAVDRPNLMIKVPGT